jgi:hypothetical protein
MRQISLAFPCSYFKRLERLENSQPVPRLALKQGGDSQLFSQFYALNSDKLRTVIFESVPSLDGVWVALWLCGCFVLLHGLPENRVDLFEMVDAFAEFRSSPISIALRLCSS